MINARVGPYRITQLLGEGGMGAVYEAVQEPLGRKVALKVLHAAHADSAEALARFFNEARAVHVVEHPGLVQISDFGQLPDGSPYLVMELLRGQTLSARLRQHGCLPLAESLHIIQQLASILHATHACGIVHRDIKPSNVMLVPDPAVLGGERVKLLDFGIAKMAATSAANTPPLTRTGIAMGTPLYMSPEQCLGASQVDGKSDVYSLGVVLFELLAGQPPFQAEADLRLLYMQIQAEPPSLSKLAPELPAPVIALVQKMLHKKREDRPDMSEVIAACEPAKRNATQLSVRPLALTRLGVSAVRARSNHLWRALLVLPLIIGVLWLLARRPPLLSASPPLPAQALAAPPSTARDLAASVDLATPADLAASVDLSSPARLQVTSPLPKQHSANYGAHSRAAPAAPAAPSRTPEPAPAPAGGVYVD